MQVKMTLWPDLLKRTSTNSKERMTKRKTPRETQRGVENIFVQNGNTAAPAGAGKGPVLVTWGCELFANGLIANFFEPSFGEKDKIEIIFKNKISNCISFNMWANGLSIKQTNVEIVRVQNSKQRW